MSSDAVWLIERDVALRDVMRELYELEGYVVLRAAAVSDVWRGVLGGQADVVIADATDLCLGGQCTVDVAEYARLSTIVPVLLLVNMPHVPASLLDNVGRCGVLSTPLEDLDRLLVLTHELAKQVLSSPTCGAF